MSNEDAVMKTVEDAMTERWDGRQSDRVTLSEIMALTVIQSVLDRGYGDLEQLGDEQRRAIVEHAADCLDYIIDMMRRNEPEVRAKHPDAFEPKEPSLIIVPTTTIAEAR